MITAELSIRKKLDRVHVACHIYKHGVAILSFS